MNYVGPLWGNGHKQPTIVLEKNDFLLLSILSTFVYLNHTLLLRGSYGKVLGIRKKMCFLKGMVHLTYDISSDDDVGSPG